MADALVARANDVIARVFALDEEIAHMRARRALHRDAFLERPRPRFS
jgi:hypothetical protein